jgi:hypothetical protein
MAEIFEGQEHGFPLARFYGETHFGHQFRELRDHASRCLAYFARARILANPKNVPGPIRGARAPDHIPSTQKMFIDLSGFRSSRLTQAANLENIPGPNSAALSVPRLLST